MHKYSQAASIIATMSGIIVRDFAANGQLPEVSQQYENMSRVTVERKAEYRSLEGTWLG